MIVQQTSIIEYPNKIQAKELLGSIANDGTILVSNLLAKYPENENIRILNSRYSALNVSEGMPGSENFTYTDDKKYITLCLRNTNGDLHSKNLVMYPFLHELAHLSTKHHDPNHGPEFKKNFRLLLSEAENIGMYTKIDFNNVPEQYCGMVIKNTIQ